MKEDDIVGQVVKRQPNGRYVIWDTSVDDFVVLNATLRQICDDYRRRHGTSYVYGVEFSYDLEAIVTTGKGRNSPYSWDDCIATIRERHGQQKADEIVAECSTDYDDPEDWDVKKLNGDPSAFNDALEAGNKLALLADVLARSGAEAGVRDACLRLADRMLKTSEERGLILDAFVEPEPWQAMFASHHSEHPRTWKAIIAADEERQNGGLGVGPRGL